MGNLDAVGQECEKYLANGKDVFWSFINLKSVYYAINRVADAGSAWS